LWSIRKDRDALIFKGERGVLVVYLEGRNDLIFGGKGDSTCILAVATSKKKGTIMSYYMNG
jgi:hypothetical protein